MAESNRVRIAYKMSGDPVTAWKTLRRTSDSLTVGTETVVSDEIRSDRKRGGQKVTTQTAGGGISIEFSAKSFDDLLAAAFMSEWSADTLEVGTDAVQIDILKSYLDEERHVLFENCEVSNMSLSMDAGAKVTGEFTVMGTTVDTDYTISTDDFADAETTLIMDSSNNLGSIQVDGSPISGMCFTAMGLELNNNHQSDQCLGEVTQNHWKGSAAVTGSITVRSSAAAFDLWEKSITNTPVKLEYTLTDGTNSYDIAVAAGYLSGDLPSGGLDAILSFYLSFTAATDGAGDYLIINRTITP